MAYNKAVDSAVLDSGLTATANAIREKTGDTALIQWMNENGFKAAVEAIEAGGGGISAWGTITPSSYTNSIATGVEIPNDNFYFAIVTISQPTKTTVAYFRCGYFVVQNGVTSGQFLGADGSTDYGKVVNSPTASSIHITIDRTNKTITFNTKSGTASMYLEGSVTFAWFMGGIA